MNQPLNQIQQLSLTTLTTIASLRHQVYPKRPIITGMTSGCEADPDTYDVPHRVLSGHHCIKDDSLWYAAVHENDRNLLYRTGSETNWFPGYVYLLAATLMSIAINFRSTLGKALERVPLCSSRVEKQVLCII